MEGAAKRGVYLAATRTTTRVTGFPVWKSLVASGTLDLEQHSRTISRNRQDGFTNGVR